MRVHLLLPLLALACTDTDKEGKDTGRSSGGEAGTTDPGTDTDTDGGGDEGGDDGTTESGDPPDISTGALSVRLVGRLGDGAAPLRGVTAWVEGDGGESTPVETDLFGVFTTPEDLPEGEYTVCADIGTPERICGAEPVHGHGVAGSVGAVDLDLPEGAVIGRALLADATPCVWRFDAFDVEGQAEVQATVSGRAVQTTGVAADGSFVVLAEAGDAVKLEASCGTATTEGEASAGETGVAELYFDNLPPSVYGIVATGESGVVNRALPGETLELAVQVADDGGDDTRHLTCHFKNGWVADDGIVVGEDCLHSFVMNDGGVPQTTYVLVDDGEGGFGVHALTIQPAESDPYLAVRVIDEDRTPLEGLTVTVDGTGVDTDETGVAGFVGAPEVAPGDALTVTVSGRGYADSVVPLVHPAGDIVVPMVACETHTFDPTSSASLTTSAHGDAFLVSVPAGILVDAAGAAVKEDVEACIAMVQSEELLPVTLRATAGKDLEARMPAPAVSAWVDFRLVSDPTERVYAKSDAVKVSLKTPEGTTWGERTVLEDWRMPAGADRWDPAGGTLAHVGGTITTTIDTPTWITPAPEQDVGCVRIWADRLRLEGGPFWLRFVYSNASGALTVGSLPLEDVPNMLRPLPPASTVNINVYDYNPATYTGAPSWSATLNTGSILRTGHAARTRAWKSGLMGARSSARGPFRLKQRWPLVGHWCVHSDKRSARLFFWSTLRRKAARRPFALSLVHWTSRAPFPLANRTMAVAQVNATVWRRAWRSAEETVSCPFARATSSTDTASRHRSSCGSASTASSKSFRS